LACTCDPSYYTGGIIGGLQSRLTKAKSQHPVQIITKAARHQWFTHVILATQEAEIRRISVQSQPRKTILEILS
jgi:hypothetical protein